MYEKHGAFYLVKHNKWTRLGSTYNEAFAEYTRLTSGPDGAALADLVTRTLADLKRDGLAENTLRMYRVAAKKVLTVFGDFSPSQIKPHNVAIFLDEMKETKGAANIAHAFLRNVFKRGVRWGIIEADPSRDIDRFSMAGRDRYITPDEYQAIKAKANETLKLMMDLAYITGQRIGDCRMTAYDDISENGMFVIQQKTKQKLLVAMSDDLKAVVESAKQLHTSVKAKTLFHRRDGTPIPYRTIHGWWVKACKDAGVENAKFHDLRAAAGTDAKESGRDSKTLLGHTTETAHNKYLRSKTVKIASPNPGRKMSKNENPRQ